MSQRDTNQRRSHSRRRRQSRGRDVFGGLMIFLFVLILFAGVIAGGVYGYRYWEGNRTSNLPLEASREVVPETMQGNKK
jgi:ABC-type Fe3+ transport system permease subunit